MTHTDSTARRDELCRNSHDMGMNTRDAAVLGFFAAWFCLTVLAMSGETLYAAAGSVPLAALSATALYKWRARQRDRSATDL